MIPFKNRFHGHSSLNYVYKNGQAVRCHSMIIKVVANKHRDDSRIAIVISKKTLKSAVGRNRIRRRLYETIRSILPTLKGVYDIAVIVTSSDIINLSPGDMTNQVNQLLNQVDALTSDNKGVQKNS